MDWDDSSIPSKKSIYHLCVIYHLFFSLIHTLVFLSIERKKRKKYYILYRIQSFWSAKIFCWSKNTSLKSSCRWSVELIEIKVSIQVLFFLLSSTLYELQCDSEVMKMVSIVAKCVLLNSKSPFNFFKNVQLYLDS